MATKPTNPNLPVTNLMLLNEFSQFKLSMEKERRCQREEIKQLRSEILFLDDTNSQLQQVIEKQSCDFQQLQQQVALLSTQLHCLRHDFAKDLNSGDETNHAESSLNHSLTPYNAMIKSQVKEEEYLSHTPLHIVGTHAYDDQESPYSLDVTVVDVANPATQDASSPRIKSQEFGEMDYSSLTDATKSGSQDDTSLEDFSHCLTPYNAMIKSQQVKQQEYLSHTPLQMDATLASPYSLDVTLVDAATQSLSSPKIKSQAKPENYFSPTPSQIQGSCSSTLAYDDQVSTNSLEVNSIDAATPGSQVASSPKDLDLLLTPFSAKIKSQEFREIGSCSLRDQQAEEDNNISLLNIPTGYFSHASSYSSNSSSSTQLENQKLIEAMRAEAIAAKEMRKRTRPRKYKNFTGLRRRLFDDEENDSEVKASVEVLSTERDLLNTNKEQEAEISQLKLLLEEKTTEVENLKHLCSQQSGEIKHLKSATLFKDVANYQLQQLIEKHVYALKQANQVLPDLQRQVSCLTGQKIYLQKLLEKQDAELKEANRVIPTLEGLVLSLTDQLQGLAEDEDFSLGDANHAITPSSPDNLIFEDPFFAKIQSQEKAEKYASRY